MVASKEAKLHFSNVIVVRDEIDDDDDVDNLTTS